jgi:hypothetical protein
MANTEGFTFSNTDTVTGDRLNTTIRSAIIDVANNVTGELATANIADNAITSAKIADGTIVNADIADGTIEAAKLSSGATFTKYSSTAVTLSATPGATSFDFLKANSNFTSAHSLGAQPHMVNAYLVANQAPNGGSNWATNDRIFLDGELTSNSGVQNNNFVVWSNATHVGVTFAKDVDISMQVLADRDGDSATGAMITMELDEWDLVIEAVLLA